MKKPTLAAMALLSAGALMLNACSAGTGGGSSTASGGEPLAMVGLYNGPMPNALAVGAKAAAEAEGSAFTQYGPAGLDPNKAISDFQNAVASGAKGVLVMAYPGDLWRSPIDRAAGQGVTVATADNFSEGSKAVTNVAAPKVAMGAALADEYIKQLPTDAKGVIVPGLCVAGLDVLLAPLNGFKLRMEEQRPGIDVIEPEVTAGDPAGNFAAWQRIVAKYPDALGFVGACDVDLPNMIKIKETGAKALMGVTSGGDDPAAVKAISGGLIVGAVGQRPWLQGYVGMKLIANQAFHGTQMPAGWINTGYEVVTAKNVGDIVAILENPAQAAAVYKALGDKIVNDADELAVTPVSFEYDVASIDQPNPQP